MAKYNKIKTKYVRNKVRQASLKDKNYIDALIRIEEFANGGVMGLHSGYERLALQEQFSKEWKAINMEMWPKDYKKELEEERKEEAREKRESEEMVREERLETQKEFAAWKKAKASC